jgi:hypothetical protein
MTNWTGTPIPPSQLQVIVKDNPFNRAYGAAFGRRRPMSLAASFEDYLQARVRRAGHPDEIFEFLKACLYAKDSEIYGRPEVWIHPEDFERNHAGDCEDMALWAWVQFVRLGWDARFTAGMHGEGGHAWVTLYREEGVLVCESTSKKRTDFLVPAAERPEYEPVWSVSGDTRFFWHGPPVDQADIRYVE